MWAVLRALWHRPFALLWSGQTTSRFGDALYRIALAWWVVQQTGSATAMGAVFVLSTAPMLVFLPFGGLVSDRFPRVTVMLSSDLLRGVLVAGVALLDLIGRLSFWHIYLASALFGLVEAFFQPAYTAAIPEITPQESLTSANSLSSLSLQTVGVVGPAVGALIVGRAGTSLAFALDAASFFVSSLFLLPLLAISQRPRLHQRTGRLFVDLREGLSVVAGTPWLWVTIGIASVSNVTLAGPRAVVLPFLVKDHLHADVGALGLLYSSASVGAVIAAVWLGRIRRIPHRGVLAYAAWITSGAALMWFGAAPSVAMVVPAAVVLGASVATFGLIWTNSLQELVPRDLLGRVSSIDYLGSFALLPVGMGVAAWATERVGAPSVFLLGGAATTVLAIAGLAHRAIRRLE